MPIDFDASRWTKLKDNYRQYWAGTLDRPLISAAIRDKAPDRPQPAAPILSQANCHDLSIPAEDLIDRIDYEISQYTFLGDSYPFCSMMHFGPGVISAFMGGILDNSTGSVWFHPAEDKPIQELHFQFDPDNVWFRRVRDIYAAGMRRWQGQVLMGMTDLGGNMDILSAFRPGEKLLLDLYDNSEEVHRLVWEAHKAWHQYYNALNEVLQPINPGYSDWSGIYYENPGYILQCDFSYMIGPEMYDEFALPEIAKTCKILDTTFFHLDGKGALPHLDSLLKIPELNGVQWVPGTGAPDCIHWPEVYQKIAAAGKRIQLTPGSGGGFEALDIVSDQIGTAKGILTYAGGPQDEVRRQLAKYGIE